MTLIIGAIALGLYCLAVRYEASFIARLVLFVATVVCITTGILEITDPTMIGQ